MPNSADLLNQISDQKPLLKSATEIAANDVAQEFQKFLADIETLTKSLATLTGAELEVAKANLTKRIAAAKVILINARTNVSEKASETIKAADAYVHDEPWKAVGVGTAVGLLLGIVLARRN